jgi:hypothetical protein
MFENRSQNQRRLIAEVLAYDDETIKTAQLLLNFATGRVNMPRSEGSLRALVSACAHLATGGSEKKWKDKESEKAERWFRARRLAKVSE